MNDWDYADWDYHAQREDLVTSWLVRGLKILVRWGWTPTDATKRSRDDWEWEVELPPFKWGKIVWQIDPRGQGGYAFIGDWINKNTSKVKLVAWFRLLVIARDDRLEAYVATFQGVYRKVFQWEGGDKKAVIAELRQIAELIEYVFGLIHVRGHHRELGPVPEWLAFPSF
jgi:hypothetical protein